MASRVMSNYFFSSTILESSVNFARALKDLKNIFELFSPLLIHHDAMVCWVQIALISSNSFIASAYFFYTSMAYGSSSNST